MLHLVFNRPTRALKVYSSPGGAILRDFEASGAAWGDGVTGDKPYGFEYPIAPGHYLLTGFSRFEPIPSEGAGQINVADIDDATLAHLKATGLARECVNDVTIGGLTLPIGMLAHWNRSAILLHTGGSNLGVPACYAPRQELCKTEGCTRLHTEDFEPLLGLLDARSDGTFPETVIFTVVGDPAPCSC